MIFIRSFAFYLSGDSYFPMSYGLKERSIRSPHDRGNELAALLPVNEPMHVIFIFRERS
jgi:hypothetical protein